VANSPFQTSGNVADIAPVQLKGGFTPAPSLLQGVADVAEIVVPAIRDNFEESLVNDVTGKSAAVSLALKATRFPSIQDSIFSDEALANPSVANALKEFTLIQDAARQGRLPSTFALERFELIQNNAIKNAPEFEAEIRGAMRDATGQDPQKALMSRLLSESSKVKSAEQKAQDKLLVDATQLGISVDQMVGINQSVMHHTLEGNKFDLAAKQGTYTLNTLGSDVVNRGATIVTDIMATIQRLGASNTPIGVEEKLQLTTQVNASFGAATAALLAKTSGLNVSGTQIQAELTGLRTLQENTIKMIEDGTLQTMLTQYTDVAIKQTQNNVLNNAEYSNAFAIGGGRGFLELVKFMSKSGGSAEGKALTAALSGDAAIAFDLQNLPKQYGLIGSPAKLETTKEKQERVMAAGVALGTTEIPEEFQIAALEDIKKYGGAELAWSSFGSNKVLTATAKSNKLKAAFINMQVTTTAGLSQELVELAHSPNNKIDRITQSANGNLVFDVTAADKGMTGQEIDAIANTHAFVKRFNRANSISAKYNGAGVLPSSRYTGAVDYWNVVKQAATETVTPKEGQDVKIIKYIRNADGSITPITEGE